MHSDLKVIDPIWVSAQIGRTHAYLVYDTLFSLDADLKPQPQMVDSYTVSPDGLVYTFKLRDGLRGTTARRCWPRTASSRSSAGPSATAWASA